MARSFQQVIASSTGDFSVLANDTSTASINLAKVLANQCLRKIYNLEDWNFNRLSTTVTSVASQQLYAIPATFFRVRRVEATSGGTTYVPLEVTAGDIWDRLNSVTSTSDVPSRWYWDDTTGKVGLWPTPASSGNTITVYGQRRLYELGATANADYTTGTITGTSGVNTLTVSGGTWVTPDMVGRAIQPANANYWYFINSLTASVATLSQALDRTYSAVSYTLAEMVPLPDGFEDLPLFYALNYYNVLKDDWKEAERYKEAFDEGLKQLYRRDRRTARGILTKDVLDKVGNFLINPNQPPNQGSIS